MLNGHLGHAPALKRATTTPSGRLSAEAQGRCKPPTISYVPRRHDWYRV